MHDLMSHIENERNINHVIPFIALTETWLKSYIADAQVTIPGYVTSRCDRDKRVGGGVLLYSHQDIPLSSCETFDDSVCQALFGVFHTVKMCVAIVYRPPNASHSSFLNSMKFIRSKIAELDDDSYQFCISGDFNFPLIDWQSLSVSSGASSDTADSANCLLSFMSDHLMNQYVTVPTRENNILDLFITNNDNLVTNVSSTETDISDHNMVDIMISFNPASPYRPHVNTFDEDNFRSLNFFEADFDVLNQKFGEIDWEMLQSSCSDQDFPALFTDTLFQICKSVVPPKKVSAGKPKALNSLRRRKKKLQTRLSAVQAIHGTQDQRARELQNQIALICYEIKEAINQHLNMREQKAASKIKSNPKFFFSYAKSFSQTKSGVSMLFDKNKVITTDPKEMANSLQAQFSSVYSDPNATAIKPPVFDPPKVSKPFEEYSLSFTDEDIKKAIKDLKSDSAAGPDGIPAMLIKGCADELCKPIRLIWEKSMSSGIVPDYYKKAYVSPLYKKGNKAEAANYRPISLTSHIVKVYERVLRKVMVQFLEDNKILSCKQHGFRSGRSCLTQMLSHIDNIMLGLTENMDTDSIYLDYAKAFDKVDHELLLQKLQKYGFGSQIINWVKSFLCNRKQSVVVNGVHSIIASIISGVPQGTVLGPLLFILFINDLQDCVSHSRVSFFADDTRVSKHISSEQDVKLLQEDLDSVILWSLHNNMKLHEDKFELMVHRHNPKNPLYELPFVTSEVMSYSVSSGDSLQPTRMLRDLGVTVSSDLSWTPHISAITCKARSVASWVFSVFRTRDPTTMLTLYKSLVRSLLEYCCPLWNPKKVTDIQLLESVQRTFTSRISSVKHLNYWDRLKSLRLMSLQRRRERYIILQMWKVLNNACPNDLDIKFHQSSRHGLKANLPQLSKSSTTRHQSLYDSSFAVLGPRLWNIIPCSLTHEPDFQQFKNSVTKFVQSVPDEPPVTGYSTTNTNSLLDWCQNTKGWSDNAMAF